MPPARTGAGPLMDPPRALTRLRVVNSWFVSNSHRSAPSVDENARSASSFDGDNTAPGIAVTAENSAPLQARPGLPHLSVCGGGAYHARAPVARSIACRPPGAAL